MVWNLLLLTFVDPASGKKKQGTTVPPALTAQLKVAAGQASEKPTINPALPFV